MADPTITVLAVRDAGGTTQNTATVVQGGNEFPAHVGYGWDGSTTLHPLLVDSAGRPLISGAAASGAALAGNPVLVGGSDGTDARSLLVDASGRPIIAGPETAGSALVGGGQRMMGSDGTNARDLLTDTTGKLITPFSRYQTVRGNFNASASATYGSAYACIGGKITVATGLAAGSQVLVDTVDFIMQGTITVGPGAILAALFPTSPTGTWTDGSVGVWSAADAESRIDTLTITLALEPATSSNIALGTLGTATRSRLATVDGSGNLYATFAVNAAPTWTGTVVCAWGVQFRY